MFLPAEKPLDDVPETILQMFGTMEFVMKLDITNETQLAQSDPEKIINVISEKGFYIQIPPKDIQKNII